MFTNQSSMDFEPDYWISPLKDDYEDSTLAHMSMESHSSGYQSWPNSGCPESFTEQNGYSYGYPSPMMEATAAVSPVSPSEMVLWSPAPPEQQLFTDLSESCYEYKPHSPTNMHSPTSMHSSLTSLNVHNKITAFAEIEVSDEDECDIEAIRPTLFDFDANEVLSPHESETDHSGYSNVSSIFPLPSPPTCGISVFKTEAPVSQVFPQVADNKKTLQSIISKKIRQRRGKQPILWQFLYHALEHTDDYGHMIRWVNKSQGVFEFNSKNKDCLARAWGAVKNNRCTMNYPKLARALRKYIEGDKYLTKMKRKLQYVFKPEFLAQLRQGKAFRQLSENDIEKMYQYSREQC